VEKCLTLGEQQYFCLGRRYSKHKTPTYPKNLGGAHKPQESCLGATIKTFTGNRVLLVMRNSCCACATHTTTLCVDLHC